MQLIGLTREEMALILAERSPQSVAALGYARGQIPYTKVQIEDYQAMALYILAKQYNKENAHILEIGTAAGHSAAIIAQAAPGAWLTTLNPASWEVKAARESLAIFPKVMAEEIKSWDYLATYSGPYLDMIFVDGDHKRVAEDLPWFNWLVYGGLMLFHDYSPEDALKSPCAYVYAEINGLATRLGRPLDVLLVDNRKVGMAGFYRKEGEGV